MVKEVFAIAKIDRVKIYINFVYFIMINGNWSGIHTSIYLYIFPKNSIWKREQVLKGK